MARSHWTHKLFGWQRQASPRRRAARPARTAKPWLEALEDRLAPATLTVNGFLDNTTADPELTLREAILLVNNGGDAMAALGRSLTFGEELQVDTTQPFGTNDTIQFAAGPAQTITLTSGELVITTDLRIEGPGAKLLTVSGNHASGVFHIWDVFPHNFAFSGLTIADGNSSNFGGGLLLTALRGSNLTIQDCVFSGNTSAKTGGGLYAQGNYAVGVPVTSILISNTTFTNNQAFDTGAAALFNYPSLLTNCTFSGNRATDQFGCVSVAAADIAQRSAATFMNCTIANNSDQFAGGIFVETEDGAYSATAQYANTIFANRATSGPYASNILAHAFGSGVVNVISLGHNLSDDGSGNLTAAGDLPNTNPLLSPLGNYGGSTPTMALLPGSPAIHAGTGAGAPVQDQRGVIRVGLVDIGAFQSQGFIMSMLGGNNQQALINSGFAAPLSAQVSSTFGEPVQGGVVTFYAPASGASATFPNGQNATIDANGQASLSLDANGTPGSYAVTAGANGASSADFTLINLPAITLSPTTLPSGTYATGYSQLLVGSGGAGGPYTFAVAPGALPANLMLAANGLLSGIPTTVGTFSFTVQITDGAHFTDSQNCSLTIAPATLTANGILLNVTAGAPFRVPVATFNNVDPYGSAASYTAVILWGDGSQLPGIISGSGTLTVSGSHTYASPGTDTVQVQISHKLGYTTTATTTALATIISLGQGVQRGQTAGIGFWSNNNGQALIKNFNGGATATALSTWLATAFPNLYGANAGANKLTGQSNAQVAAFYLSQFRLGRPKVEAEALATALNVYATTLSLGGTAGQSYGFSVSWTGLGACSVNVGPDGTAFGVANHTTCNVYQLLLAVNQQAVAGVLYNGNTTLRQEAADLLDTLNS